MAVVVVVVVASVVVELMSYQESGLDVVVAVVALACIDGDFVASLIN